MINGELIVDNFAGGGGASTGIEIATGYNVDIAINHDYTGKTYPRSEQVKRCGNAVCPPIPAALVKSNLPELCKAKRQPNFRTDRVSEEKNGQLRFV